MPNFGRNSQERRQAAEASARADSIILLERDDMTVAVPLTEDAAKWWGRGTRWPASAVADNSFSRDNATSPVIVVALPDMRLNLWMSPDGVRFRDAANADVTPDLVARRWDDLEPLILWAAEREPAAMLPFVPESRRDRGMGMAAVKQDGMALVHIHPALRDREMSMVAVKQNGLAIMNVHPALRDREMCMEAVKQDGLALQHVESAMRSDRGLCVEAVKQNWRALEYVNPVVRDMDICSIALAQDNRAAYSVPDYLHDQEPVVGALASLAGTKHMVLASLGKADAISELPDYGIDWNSGEAVREGFEITVAKAMDPGHSAPDPDAKPAVAISRGFDIHESLKAVRNSFVNLDFLPANIKKDNALVMAAVNNTGHAIRPVPEGMTDREIILAAVTRTHPFVPLWTPEDALEGLSEALADHAVAPAAPRR